MDINKIKILPIADIAPVYGGVRGRTMSSQHDIWWFEIKDAGVKTIIDLRDGGENTRIVAKGKMYGLDYFCYPVVNHLEGIRKMVELFPEFCRLIDEGNFYKRS